MWSSEQIAVSSEQIAANGEQEILLTAHC